MRWQIVNHLNELLIIGVFYGAGYKSVTTNRNTCHTSHSFFHPLFFQLLFLVAETRTLHRVTME